MTKTVIIVDIATSGAKGIAQHMAKYVINVVVRTTLRQCAKADPVRDQKVKGQIGPMGKNVPINVGCMKSMMIVMMRMTGILRTSQTRSSHYFMLRDPIEILALGTD